MPQLQPQPKTSPFWGTWLAYKVPPPRKRQARPHPGSLMAGSGVPAHSSATAKLPAQVHASAPAPSSAAQSTPASGGAYPCQVQSLLLGRRPGPVLSKLLGRRPGRVPCRVQCLLLGRRPGRGRIRPATLHQLPGHQLPANLCWWSGQDPGGFYQPAVKPQEGFSLRLCRRPQEGFSPTMSRYI